MFRLVSTALIAASILAARSDAQVLVVTAEGFVEFPQAGVGIWDTVDFGDPFTCTFRIDSSAAGDGGLITQQFPGALLSADIDFGGVTSSAPLTSSLVLVTNDLASTFACQDQFYAHGEATADYSDIELNLWEVNAPCPPALTNVEIPTTLDLSVFDSATTVTLNTSGSPSSFITGTITTLTIELEAFAEACNGDGGDQLGCTDCPCANDAPAGSAGGCLNSAATSCRMIVTGSSSISAAELRVEASGVPPTNAVQLTSGDALAPANPANPCFGLGSGIQALQLDGLRCVVQGVLRHGVRAADANGEVGVTTNGWGTPNGFFNFDAFTAGQAKHFQLIYRDDATLVCQTGQNTSQAVTVPFTP